MIQVSGRRRSCQPGSEVVNNDMPSGKFCPVCKRKNLAEATHCSYCQALLEGGAQDADTTEHVAVVQPELVVKPAQHLPRLAQLPVNALELFVLDNEEPIQIKECVKVVLGRHISQASIPVVDLGPYEANRFGVSRQHAIIVNMQDSFTIQDLESTNGTWVNGQRLQPGKAYPFSNGSQVRLGQLTLYAYFRLRAASEDILLLYEEMRGATFLRPALSLDYLTEVIHPYLQALVDVQRLLDEARGQQHGQVQVNTISASRTDSPIGIGLSGASDAVRVVRELVPAWRKAKAGVLAGPAAAASSGVTGQSKSSTGRLSSSATRLIEESELPQAGGEPYSAELQAAVQELAHSVLEQFLPGDSSHDRDKRAGMLVPPLLTLATSKLQLYLGGPSSGGA